MTSHRWREKILCMFAFSLGRTDYRVNQPWITGFLYCPVYYICIALYIVMDYMYVFYPVHSLPICDPVPLLNKELFSKLFVRF